MAYAKSSLLTQRNRNAKRSYYGSVADLRKTQQAYGQAQMLHTELEQQGQSLDRQKLSLESKMLDYRGRENAPGSLDQMLSDFYGEGGKGEQLTSLYKPYSQALGFAKDTHSSQQETGEFNPFMGDPDNIMRGLYHGGSDADKKGWESYGMAKAREDAVRKGDKGTAYLLYGGTSYADAGKVTDYDAYRKHHLGSNYWIENVGSRWKRKEARIGRWESVRGGFLNLSFIRAWNPFAKWTETVDVHDRIMNAAKSRTSSASQFQLSGVDKTISGVESDISNIKSFKSGKDYQDFTAGYKKEYGGYEKAKTAYDTFIQRGSDYQKLMTRRTHARTQFQLAGKNLKDAKMRSQSAYKSFKGMQGGIGQGMGIDYKQRQAGFGYGGTV